MPCNCNKASSAHYVLTLPNGTTKTYSSLAQVTAAAARLGGTWVKK